jgi:2-iminobutanoate/2-iminopropanoate deaminase
MNMKHFLSLMSFLTMTNLSAQINVVATDEAPKAVGPYSQAIHAGQFLFISGQLARDPKTSQFVGDTIEKQTVQVLNNIEAILHAQGLTFENVVKAEVYLKDLNDFNAMNAIYASRFNSAAKPARQAMQVARLPMDALIEISCIAFVP